MVKTSLTTIQTRTATLWKQLEGDEKAQEKRKRQRSAQNLQQIGRAVQDHAHINYRTRTFPPQAICDKDGKPLLSWRVAILPELREFALYRQFKLDEAWDSPHNLKLLAKMPRIYAPPAGIKTRSRT